ncbi:hypothetical protein NSS79_10610 [Paenibacillus sp. FSL L8-0436]|uniref:hypothetical protein n=1 Tax=Paenibacillus sp. FSL L8-0436 TaxID=2954686 RepID=UPI0031581E6C
MDENWEEVMTLAEKYGLILQAANGVALLATHAVQIERYGEEQFVKIQEMNGRRRSETGIELCEVAE